MRIGHTRREMVSYPRLNLVQSNPLGNCNIRLVRDLCWMHAALGEAWLGSFHEQGTLGHQLSLGQVRVTTNDPCCSRLYNATTQGLVADLHEFLHNIPLASVRAVRRRHMAIEDQHILRTPLMPQVRPLHKDLCLRAKLVHGFIAEQQPFITRNEGYIWRVRSYDYVISIHLLYDLLEKCLSGRLDVSGRL